MKIFISAGHHDKDPGAINKPLDLYEHDQALKIYKILKKTLRVLMERDLSLSPLSP